MPQKHRPIPSRRRRPQPAPKPLTAEQKRILTQAGLQAVGAFYPNAAPTLTLLAHALIVDLREDSNDPEDPEGPEYLSDYIDTDGEPC